MSSITYVTNIPNPTDNPSQDVSVMQANTAAVNSWTAVDHIPFNTAGSGQHQQVTFTNVEAPPGATSPVSIAFTQFGTDDPSVPQLFYQNANITTVLSAVKAFATFAGSTGATSNAYNCTVSRTGTGAYNITVSTGGVTSSSFLVIATCSKSGSNVCGVNAVTTGVGGATINAFLISSQAAADPTTVSFVVLQI